MEKQNKVIFIVVAIVAVIVIYQFANIKTAVQNVTNNPIVEQNGAQIKAVIVDENGVVKQDLTPSLMPESFSVISYEDPTGYGIISPPTCTSNCAFLVIDTSINNEGGDSNILVNSVTPSTSCASNNPLKSTTQCTNLVNLLGEPTTEGNKRGNLIAKYSSPATPFTLNIGQASSAVASDSMSLDEVSYGLINFRIDVDGTFKDAYGNDLPLSNKFAQLTLNVQQALCNGESGVGVDPTTANDDSSYCSNTAIGEYCRVGTQGIPTLTKRASLCGCCTPGNPSDILCNKYPDGENCAAVSCTPNHCIEGTVLYCKADGKSLETRCDQCGVANCLQDANSKNAVSCSATGDRESQCIYPGGTGSNLLVSITVPQIQPLTSCGDGIKVAGEDCDKNDFGGATCSSVGTYSGGTLTCNSDCKYNIDQCLGGYVNFRTQLSAVSSQENADGIAFQNGCSNSPLTRAGEYPAGNGESTVNCNSALISNGYTKMFDITQGVVRVTKGAEVATGNFELYANGDVYALAGTTGGSPAKCIWVGFRETQASAISSSPYTVDTSKEMNC